MEKQTDWPVVISEKNENRQTESETVTNTIL